MDSTATRDTAAPTITSYASRPSNGRKSGVYNDNNGTERNFSSASILGNRKPFSVKFKDEPTPTHERATSDDFVVVKPSQEPNSIYSRMGEKDWAHSEASVNTHTNRTNGTYTHSNEALINEKGDGKTQRKNGKS
jgi:hypothetical protein